MNTTIQKIAELANVSRGTVDRVINKRGKVSQEVEMEVLKVIDDLGFVQKPRKKRCNFTIGVITQLVQTSFMQEIEKGISRAIVEVSQCNVNVFVKESAGLHVEEQLRNIDELVDLGIQALAIMPIDDERIRNKLNEIIDKHNIQVITFNTDILGTRRLSFVGLDNEQSGKAAAGLLGMLQQGKGKTLIINGYFSNRNNCQRIDAFLKEMQIAFPNITILGVQSSQDEEDKVEEILRKAMRQEQDLTGVFLVSAGQSGACRALANKQGEKRPFIVAYDRTAQTIAALHNDDFDFLIDQENSQQGYYAITMLYAYLAKHEVPSEYVYTNIQLKTKYTV